MANKRSLKEELKILFVNRGVRIYSAVVACVLLTLIIMGVGQLDTFLKTSLLEDLAKYQIGFEGTTQPISDLPNYNASKLDPFVYSTAYLGNYLSYSGSTLQASTENGGSHPGVDIIAPLGTPVRAIANGLVINAGARSNGFGKQIVIGHPNVADPANPNNKTNLFSLYAHLHEINVKEGDLVKKGQLIGKVGQTGFATTPHLHFQIDRDDALFHPYWPFTTKEADAAGLNFTEAVSAGLGQQNGRLYTVNPLVYTQSYANYSAPAGVQLTSGSANSSPDNNVFLDFSLGGNTALAANQQQELELQVVDINNQLFPNFQAQEDVRIIVPSEQALEGTIILSPSRFQQGKAQFKLTPLISGELNLTVRYGDLRSILDPIKVTGGTPTNTSTSQPSLTLIPTASAAELTPPLKPAYKAAEEPWQLYKLDYISPLIMGQSYRLSLAANDERGMMRSDFQPASALSLSWDQTAALVGPNSLKPEDFSNGRATIYYNPAKSGRQTLRLNDDQSAYLFNLDVRHPDELKAEKIVIEHAGTAKTGETVTLTIRVINAFNASVPGYTPSNFSLTTSDPHGLFHATQLTAADFHDGVALANYIPAIPGETLIIVKDGELSGLSAKLNVTGKPLIVTAISNPATPSANLAADFPDVPLAHRNATAIYELKKRSIIKGYEDGSFQPDRPVARIEILKILLSGFNKSVDQSVTKTDFPDVTNTGWYPPYVAAGRSLSIIKGYEDGSFRPQKTVSRIEALKMLFVSQNIAPEATVNNKPYPDVALDNWYTGYVSKASSFNLIDAVTGGLFLPDQGMTRGEVAELIYRLLYIQEKGVNNYPTVSS